MNEVCERALECYIKKLESDNEKLRDFANEVRSSVFDFDGANPIQSDKDIVADIRSLVRSFEVIFDEK